MTIMEHLKLGGYQEQRVILYNLGAWKSRVKELISEETFMQELMYKEIFMQEFVSEGLLCRS